MADHGYPRCIAPDPEHCWSCGAPPDTRAGLCATCAAIDPDAVPDIADPDWPGNTKPLEAIFEAPPTTRTVRPVVALPAPCDGRYSLRVEREDGVPFGHPVTGQPMSGTQVYVERRDCPHAEFQTIAIIGGSADEVNAGLADQLEYASALPRSQPCPLA